MVSNPDLSLMKCIESLDKQKHFDYYQLKAQEHLLKQI